MEGRKDLTSQKVPERYSTMELSRKDHQNEGTNHSTSQKVPKWVFRNLALDFWRATKARWGSFSFMRGGLYDCSAEFFLYQL
jgi:hypothetical protein